MRNLTRRALTPLAVMLLAACGAENDKAAETTEQVQPSSRSLAATLRAESGYGSLGRIATNAGLTDVLDGVGPYTLFAPADAAFPADAAPTDVADESRRAESAALIQAHIVPGALTRQDIAAALDGDADGSVQMRTMANTLLTFSRDGSAIVVTSEGGARGRLTGEEKVASNGVMQPVDALLVRPDASGTPAA